MPELEFGHLSRQNLIAFDSPRASVRAPALRLTIDVLVALEGEF
ncbi:hypothetical protein X741_18220 [Mesorhizobium sp. LNHC229A00]|nr:hypothetical protein X741_18220 [Mesorhizobium sp. LNHC229A00]